MKIKMIKGAANPKPNDFMILTIAEISNIRSENAKLRDIAERAINLALEYYDGPCERNWAKLRRELDKINEGAK